MKRLLHLIVAAFWSVLLTVRAFSLFTLALLLAASGFSFAQTADPSTGLGIPGFDFKAWGSSAALFGVFVASLVGLLKGRLPRLQGWAVLLLSLAISEVGAFLLFTAGVLTDPSFSQFAPPYIWMLFGLSAFVVASGGMAVLLQLATSRGASVVTVPLHVMAAAHELHPVGTPGTVPLHDLDGEVIGAVKPLTASVPQVSK